MKQKTTILTAITALMATMTIALILSCDSDDLFGLDEQQQTAQTSMTRAGIDMSEYLTLKTYDVDKWTGKEYMIFGRATERIGITFKNNQYVFQASCGKDVNISDSLYTKIRSMFNVTNRIFSNNLLQCKRINRRKSSSSEIVGVLPNCVPMALSHMHSKRKPTDEEAKVLCSVVYPDWENKGGVPYIIVEDLVKLYTDITTYKNLDFCTGDTTLLYNSVMQFNVSGNKYHAVNADRCVQSGNRKLIIFNDFSDSHMNGPLFEDELYELYLINAPIR